MQQAEAQSDTMPIRGIPRDDVVEIWPHIESILSRAVLPETGWTLDHVLTALQFGQKQLFVIGEFDAVVIASIDVLPLHRVLWIDFIAGTDMSEWLDEWIEVQDRIARQYDCKYVEFRGRQGWKRVREKHPEFKVYQTIIRKEM